MGLRYTLVKGRQKRCVCCESTIRVGERMFDLGKGEKYCERCEAEAMENNPDHPAVVAENGEIDAADDGERHLRQMEDFGAYQAAGCTHAYWEDRDAGFAH
jgi:hypothetical protein